MCLLVIGNNKQRWFDIVGDSDRSRQEQEVLHDIKLHTISDGVHSM